MQRKAHIFFGGYLILFAIIFLYFGVKELRQDARFNEDAVRSTGRIEQIWTAAGRGNTHWVRYEYEVGEDDPKEGKSIISPSTFAVLRVGEPVPIKYLREQPETSRIDFPLENRWHWRNDEIGFGVGILAATAGLCVIYFNWRR